MTLKIIKKINNNVALAVDGAGKELVVFGKGIGFPPTPYELADTSRIQRIFYDIKSGYAELAASLPEDMILLAADIAELAQEGLGCKLNPNLPFTLADHLCFAMERWRSGFELKSPLAYDVEHFYPVEMSLSQRALEIIKERKKIELPASEAVNIALHLVNGELESSDMHATLKATEVIRDVTGIIERTLNIELDTTSFNYSRFITHIRYLLLRMEKNEQEDNGMSVAMRQLGAKFPEVYRCARKVQDYLSRQCDRPCTKDEMMYLFMHINRLDQRSRR